MLWMRLNKVMQSGNTLESLLGKGLLRGDWTKVRRSGGLVQSSEGQGLQAEWMICAKALRLEWAWTDKEEKAYLLESSAHSWEEQGERSEMTLVGDAWISGFSGITKAVRSPGMIYKGIEMIWCYITVITLACCGKLLVKETITEARKLVRGCCNITDTSGLDHGGSLEGGEKWVDSGYVLVIESSDEKKKRIKNDSGVLGLCYCVDAGAICWGKGVSAENQEFCFRPAKFEACIRQADGDVMLVTGYESLDLRGKIEAKGIRKCP